MLIAGLFVLSSVFNIYQGLVAISQYYEFIPYSSDPRAYEWFRIMVPTEIILGVAAVGIGFLALFVVYGLYNAEPWSRDAAIGLPIIVAILNFIHVLILAFLPSFLELSGAISAGVQFLLLNIVFLIIVSVYLSRPHVKQYFSLVPAPVAPALSASSELPVPPPPDLVVKSEEKRFCRYCGVENKTDAVFCEKCGKEIG